MLRAVYARESKKDDEDAVKIILAAHPASNVGSNILARFGVVLSPCKSSAGPQRS